MSTSFWLDSPDDYSDNFVRVNERLNAALKYCVETERPRELNRIADEVFAKYGIADPNDPMSSGSDLPYTRSICSMLKI